MREISITVSLNINPSHKTDAIPKARPIATLSNEIKTIKLFASSVESKNLKVYGRTLQERLVTKI